MIDLIGIDGDDTLWHNESIFSVTQQRIAEMLGRYVPDVAIDECLFRTEMRNLHLFGYGIKGFILSVIESAIEVTEGRVSTADVQAIIDAGKWMLQHPVELLDGVHPALQALAGDHRLVLITKGDLFDQESKLARSGLGDLFWKVEIVSEKEPATYRRILQAHSVDPAHFLMVGNSLRSDILPVLEIGGRAAHIPYQLTWQHEVVDLPDEPNDRLHILTCIADVADLVRGLEGTALSREA
jgi:putative hydrolase of the HAD superfamily